MNEEVTSRYSRHLLLEGFGTEGQERLARARVLIVGAGALGTVAALYLAGAGVGHIHILDPDRIDLSNLQRQPPFTTDTVGRYKAEALALHLRRLNPLIRVTSDNVSITACNADHIIAACDLVMECSDNPPTKNLVTSTCERLAVPYVLAGVAQYSAQVLAWQPGTPPYSTLFPEAAREGEYTPCSIGGVFAPVASVAASLQAAEALKILAHVGTPLSGRLIAYNSLTSTFNEIFY